MIKNKDTIEELIRRRANALYERSNKTVIKSYQNENNTKNRRTIKS